VGKPVIKKLLGTYLLEIREGRGTGLFWLIIGSINVWKFLNC
jgi:hypothetical protein